MLVKYLSKMHFSAGFLSLLLVTCRFSLEFAEYIMKDSSFWCSIGPLSRRKFNKLIKNENEVYLKLQMKSLSSIFFFLLQSTGIVFSGTISVNLLCKVKSKNLDYLVTKQTLSAAQQSLNSEPKPWDFLALISYGHHKTPVCAPWSEAEE